MIGFFPELNIPALHKFFFVRFKTSFAHVDTNKTFLIIHSPYLFFSNLYATITKKMIFYKKILYEVDIYLIHSISKS